MLQIIPVKFSLVLFQKKKLKMKCRKRIYSSRGPKISSRWPITTVTATLLTHDTAARRRYDTSVMLGWSNRRWTQFVRSTGRH